MFTLRERMTFLLRIQHLLFLFMVVAVTPSCIKYHKIIKSEFPQGEDTPDLYEVSHDYLRSITIYDQFTTLAVFDALWLSPTVEAVYTDLYNKRRGKVGEEVKAAEAEQEKDHEEHIAFYLLADVRAKVNKEMQEPNAYWTVALENNQGNRLEAASIKLMRDLDPEYQLLFRTRFNLFKNVYLVKFPKSEVERLFFKRGEPLTMLLSSPVKNIRLSWHTQGSVQPHKKVIRYDAVDWF